MTMAIVGSCSCNLMGCMWCGLGYDYLSVRYYRDTSWPYRGETVAGNSTNTYRVARTSTPPLMETDEGEQDGDGDSGLQHDR